MTYTENATTMVDPAPERDPSESVPSVWHQFGLRGSPFFRGELRGKEESPHPPSLFVGRGTELRYHSRVVVSSLDSAVIVEGAPGVGRTSFVNRLKANLARQGVMSHDKAVRIAADMSPRMLIAEVLKVLLRIRNLAQGARQCGSSGVLRVVKESTAEAERFWTYIARLVKGQDLFNAGMSVGTVGGSFERSRIPAEVLNLSLYDELEEAASRLIAETQRSADDDRRILIHVNNLESLSAAEKAKAASLMMDVRDYLRTEGLHWVFVGETGVQFSVFGVFPMVRHAFPSIATTLPPLSGVEVCEVLDRRYRYLQRGSAFVPPVDPESAVTLYRRYHGNLGEFLELLSASALGELGVRCAQPISESVILDHMAPRLCARFQSVLGPRDFAYLVETVRGISHTDEFQVEEVAKRIQLDTAAARALVERFVRCDALVVVRPTGDDPYYSVTGNASIGLGLAA
jgi:hypothetical protein